MQLHVHLGLVTKAEDMKSLGWLISSLQGNILHCVSLYMYTKLVCWICAPQTFSCYSSINQVSRIISVPIQLDSCPEQTPPAF